jgi:hypothetical protein
VESVTNMAKVSRDVKGFLTYLLRMFRRVPPPDEEFNPAENNPIGCLDRLPNSRTLTDAVVKASTEAKAARRSVKYQSNQVQKDSLVPSARCAYGDRWITPYSFLVPKAQSIPVIRIGVLCVDRKDS